jgi:DNA repair protein RadD
VGEPRPGKGTQPVAVECPVCSTQNAFWGICDDEGRVLEHYGRRCQGFSVDDSGKRVRCEYRFRFKECRHCQAENDIAARSCSGCAAVLVDPDELLKQALRLKNALVLRVAAMTLQASGEVLTVSYHDEDAVSVSERFDFANAGQRAVWNRVFARRLAQGRRPLALELAQQALQLQAHLPRPDFVVARKVQGRMRIQERVFDYAGAYRKANELR